MLGCFPCESVAAEPPRLPAICRAVYILAAVVHRFVIVRRDCERKGPDETIFRVGRRAAVPANEQRSALPQGIHEKLDRIFYSETQPAFDGASQESDVFFQSVEKFHRNIART